MNLYDLPHNGTLTSIAAAQAKAESGTVMTDSERIADYLETWPEGATRQQIAEVLQLNPDSVRPRVRELIAAGLVYEHGDTREWGGHQASKVLRHTIHRKD